MRAEPGQEHATEQLTEALQVLNAGIGHARLYGVDHRETESTLRAFGGVINGLCEQLGPIVLVSSLEGLRWKGVRVTDERNDQRGLGRDLHREGIASLAFTAGVSLDELKRLVAVLQINLSLPRYEEETLESLLWQAELRSISFQAVSALMEAEAISGRDGHEGAAEAEEAIRQALILERGADQDPPRNLQATISEDQLRRAVDAHDLRLSGRDPTGGHDGDDATWNTLFEKDDEDHAAIQQMLMALDDERGSELLARLLKLLLRVAVARRRDVNPREAFDFARRTMEAIYRLGDPTGILGVLEDAKRLIQELANDDREATALLKRFYVLALPPLRIARTLSGLDPDDPAERRTLKRLLAFMPTDILLAMLDWTVKETEPSRLPAFLGAFAEAAGPRVFDHVHQAGRLPVEQLLPVIQLCRIAGGARERALRRSLMDKSSPAVKVALLEWYTDDLPEDELKLVVGCLADRHADVRRATIEALASRSTPAALRMLQHAISGERFEQLTPEIKTAFCVAYGRAGRDRATGLLAEIFQRKVPLFNKESASATLEAAAMGLAHTGDPGALRLLRKEAGSLRSVRSAACQKALAAMGEGP